MLRGLAHYGHTPRGALSPYGRMPRGLRAHVQGAVSPGDPVRAHAKGALPPGLCFLCTVPRKERPRGTRPSSGRPRWERPGDALWEAEVGDQVGGRGGREWEAEVGETRRRAHAMGALYGHKPRGGYLSWAINSEGQGRGGIHRVQALVSFSSNVFLLGAEGWGPGGSVGLSLPPPGPVAMRPGHRPNSLTTAVLTCTLHIDQYRVLFGHPALRPGHSPASHEATSP